MKMTNIKVPFYGINEEDPATLLEEGNNNEIFEDGSTKLIQVQDEKN